MTAIDNELLLDAEDDARAVAFIAAHLPEDVRKKMNDDVLYYFLDLLEEYYTENGTFDNNNGNSDYVDVNIDIVAQYLSEKAGKEGMGNFTPEETACFVEAELDFEESI